MHGTGPEERQQLQRGRTQGGAISRLLLAGALLAVGALLFAPQASADFLSGEIIEREGKKSKVVITIEDVHNSRCLQGRRIKLLKPITEKIAASGITNRNGIAHLKPGIRFQRFSVWTYETKKLRRGKVTCPLLANQFEYPPTDPPTSRR